MPRIVKGGLIQSHNAAPVDAPVEQIKKLNLEHQMKLIEQAAKQGVQVLCLQEVFNTPYFCATSALIFAAKMSAVAALM